MLRRCGGSILRVGAEIGGLEGTGAVGGGGRGERAEGVLVNGAGLKGRDGGRCFGGREGVVRAAAA